MVDVLDGTEIVQIPHRGPQGHTTTQAIANIAPHVAGATDANLFAVDTASDQVSIGIAAPVAPFNKFAVVSTTTDMDPSASVGHAAILGRMNMTGQGTAAVNPDGVYGIVWYEPLAAAAHFTGDGAGVRGNSYTIDTPYAANVDLMIGTYGRSRHENTHGTVTKAVALFADGAQKGPGAGTITSGYGVYIAPQTLGASNYGVFCEGTPSTGTLASDNDVTIVAGGAFAGTFKGTVAANQTALLIAVNNGATVLKTIEIGAADSGGTGFRMLRVTN